MKVISAMLVLVFGLGACASAQSASAQSVAVGEIVGALHDPARAGREIGYKIFYPKNFNRAAALVLMSHGGTGKDDGEQIRMGHIGAYLAERGYIAISLGHRESASSMIHRSDRPKDVSFVIDALAAKSLALPSDFGGSPLLDKVAHVGHSWGAYTANAVGGGGFDQGQFRDPRVGVIVPISPQGADQFGSFDRGPDDNTWRTVEVPTYMLVGSAEMRGAPSKFDVENWRAQGFARYPADGTRFMSIVPGQDHGDMGGSGSPEVLRFIAGNIEIFLDIYLRGAKTDPCKIGSLAPLAGTTTQRSMASGAMANSETCS